MDQVRPLPEFERLRCRFFLVDFDSEAWTVRYDVSISIHFQLWREELGILEPQVFCWGHTRFEPGEIGYGAAPRWTLAAAHTGPSGLCGIRSM